MVSRNREEYKLIGYLAGSAAAAESRVPSRDERLPTLKELSGQLDIGVSRLREQLEVARALGLVEVRPRTGIRRLEYEFQPAVQLSLNYAIAVDRGFF